MTDEKNDISQSPDSKPEIEAKGSQANSQTSQKVQAQEVGTVGTESKSNKAGKYPDTKIGRRSFLSWVVVGWSVFAALTVATLTGLLRFMFPNVLFEPPQSFRAGFPDEYSAGEVSTRFKDQYAVWIVRSTNEIYVLSTVCTHLGCTPSWMDRDQKFKCPCHGSGFRKSGIHFEGPAPRPLERYRVVLGDDGQLLVDKTRKYQYEKGEWSDPESFVVV